MASFDKGNSSVLRDAILPWGGWLPRKLPRISNASTGQLLPKVLCYCIKEEKVPGVFFRRFLHG
jgi:hypothetical protein